MTEKRLKKWWLLLLKGLILIVFSLIIFFYPDHPIQSIAIYFGICLIITGITLILISTELRKFMDNWTMRLAEGLIDVVFGFFLLAHPEVDDYVIPILIGFWVIFYGVIILAGSFGFEKTSVAKRKITLIVGLITILLGFVISFNPDVPQLTNAVLIGIPIFIIGLANLFFASNLKSLKE